MERFNPLEHPVCLSYPRWVAASEWIEHVPFAMLLVDLVRPEVVVELGAHYGVSYCAFCQAVDELRLPTRCYAVDTWQGDPHDGFYGDEVLGALQSHHDPLYNEFSRLIQSSFDEAVAYFPDGSIDVLHIDGYHTYEAVRHDFETWRSKLSPRAVVLFHDINVREREFGVWRFWDEVSGAFPSFAFAHGHGLGVLAVGPEVPPPLRRLIDAPPDEAQLIRQLCYQLGLRLRARQRHEREVGELAARVAALTPALAKAEADVATLHGWVRERDELIRKLDADGGLYRQWISERDDTILALQEQLKGAATLGEALAERDRQLAEREDALDQIRAQLQNAEDDVVTLHGWVRDRDELVRQLWCDKEQLLAEKAMLDAVRRAPGGSVVLALVRARRGASRAVSRAGGALRLGRRGLEVARTDGVAEVARRARRWAARRRAPAALPAPTDPASPADEDAGGYEAWIAANEPDAAALAEQARAALELPSRPLISVLTPVYNPPPAVLDAMIASVRAQTYDRWELILVNGSAENRAVAEVIERHRAADQRVRPLALPHNEGIVGNSNAGLAEAQGELVAFVDHDDTLAPFALFEVASLAAARPDLDLIYSDSDLLSPDGARRFQPLFKPDWSPAIMLSANYATHLCVVRAALLRELGGLAAGTDGAQDWDLILRVSERTGAIAHIPKVLYHWRDSPTSTAVDIARKPYVLQRQSEVITAHLRRRGLDGHALVDDSGYLRVSWPLRGATRVSVIIPSRDERLVTQCIASLRARTGYPIHEIIVVDSSPGHGLRAPLAGERGVRVLPWSGPFNYAAANNLGARAATGDALLFLNDDTEALERRWLEELVRWVELDEVGVVGAKLLFPDGAIQHAGVVVGLEGFAGHPFAGMPEGAHTAYGCSEWYRNFSAVTGACMLIRRELFERVGGFDEQLTLCGNDVALCLSVRELGYQILYTPFARLRHHESVSRRGSPIPSGDFTRSFAYYEPLLRGGDPFFSPNLSVWSPRPAPRGPGEQDPYSFVLAHLAQLDAPAPPAPTPPEMSIEPMKLPDQINSLSKQALYLTRRSAETLSSEGLGGFYTRVRRKIAPPPIRQAAWSQTYAAEAFTLAQWLDFSGEELRRSRETTARHAGRLAIGSVNWYLPHFEHAYYGGVHTILRFASQFASRHGVRSCFVILGGPEGPAPATYEQRIADAFPALAGARAVVIRSDADLPAVPDADACFATLWSTAYYVLKFNRTKRKFYFLQDYEPMFYPAGSTSAQVEASYRFGFYGVTNTVTLKTIYEQEFGGRAVHFDPCVDTGIFHPPAERAATRPSTIFYYGRPNFFRNGFELGAVALRKVKERLGDRVRIISAGQQWRPADYDLDGVVENLGLLSYRETAELYRTCDAGLAMMFTRHPSYLPFEFMASGCLVVSNVNSATSWLLKDGENCLLALPSATSIAETLVRGLEDHELRRRVTANAWALIRDQYSAWEQQIERVYAFMCDPEGADEGVTAATTIDPHTDVRS
jgi:GT2 family glycosyltransferase/glycosyltransferase involved in cell wall biosynthesis